MTKTDTELRIQHLKESDDENAYAKTGNEIPNHKKVHCCGKRRTPKAILKFPNDEYEYFVCPKCESY